ncbi:hypothetical protein RRG08_041588 [Elysia crispata]|uniref:Voltage-gated hydrogen channel 1 n=1 Tax=Elysia crispata TaxID=231223 RepID=A0AAE1E7Z9_9GAST|nr:hypothetical protein RRG08_041588 [Elysia crispata]
MGFLKSIDRPPACLLLLLLALCVCSAGGGQSDLAIRPAANAAPTSEDELSDQNVTQPVKNRPQAFKMTKFRLQGCRKKALKYIHCRPLLVAVCTLVVIECACVLTELMVDLQGIKYRFESQEKEIDRFVEHLKSKYPQAFTEASGFRSVRDLVYFLQHALPLWSPGDIANCRKFCPCRCPRTNFFSGARDVPSATESTAATNKMVASKESNAALKDNERVYQSEVRIERSHRTRRSVLGPYSSFDNRFVTKAKSSPKQVKQQHDYGASSSLTFSSWKEAKLLSLPQTPHFNIPTPFHSMSTSSSSLLSYYNARHQTRSVETYTDTKNQLENVFVDKVMTKPASRTLLSTLSSLKTLPGESASGGSPNTIDSSKAAANASADMINRNLLIPAEQSFKSTGNISKSAPPIPALSSLDDIFLLEVGHSTGSVFLLAELVPNLLKKGFNRTADNVRTQSSIYKTSKALHFVSLSILSVMVLETAVKLFCTGCAFFKKKFEVFDAFIVVSSFALDFVFLDSRWYETGKDVTTILVFLLPWRVVRIVNSFLMTMKHKHHLQIMNMKRARKKAELKSAKLQTLLTEIRKDVQLLVNLCRSHDVEEKDITACLYGKGRRKVTLSAMSTCTSLMLISTLGKDAIPEDDIYGKVFKEALNEGEVTDESIQEAQEVEEAAIEAAIQLDEQLEARRKSRKYRSRSKKPLVQRSYTVPRRTASVEMSVSNINETSGSNISYINDGFLTARGTSCRSDIMVLGPGSEFTTIDGATSTCTTLGFTSSDEEDQKDNGEDDSIGAGRNSHRRNRDLERGGSVDACIIIEDHLAIRPGKQQLLPQHSHPPASTLTPYKSVGSTSTDNESRSVKEDPGSGPSSRKGPAPALPVSHQTAEKTASSTSPTRSSAHPVPVARNKFRARGFLGGEASKRSNRSNSLVTFEVTTQVTHL